jgi:hypothetical protein
MVARTSPLTRADDESHDPSCWEYRPNLALRRDLIVYEAASLKHLLPCRFLNEAGRPLIRPRQCLNRPVRKTWRSLNSRRGLRKARHHKAGMSLTRGPSSTGF